MGQSDPQAMNTGDPGFLVEDCRSRASRAAVAEKVGVGLWSSFSEI